VEESGVISRYLIGFFSDRTWSYGPVERVVPWLHGILIDREAKKEKSEVKRFLLYTHILLSYEVFPSPRRLLSHFCFQHGNAKQISLFAAPGSNSVAFLARNEPVVRRFLVLCRCPPSKAIRSQPLRYVLILFTPIRPNRSDFFYT